MTGELYAIWRRFSVSELAVILISAPLIAQVAVGIYFNWPPLGLPLNQPRDEIWISIGLQVVAGLTISLPCLVEIRRRFIQEAGE